MKNERWSVEQRINAQRHFQGTTAVVPSSDMMHVWITVDLILLSMYELLWLKFYETCVITMKLIIWTYMYLNVSITIGQAVCWVTIDLMVWKCMN